jgi:hypothetical protein
MAQYIGIGSQPGVAISAFSEAQVCSVHGASYAVKVAKRSKACKRAALLSRLRAYLLASTASELDAAINAAAEADRAGPVFGVEPMPAWWSPLWDRWLLLGSASWGMAMFVRETVAMEDGRVLAAGTPDAHATKPGSIAMGTSSGDLEATCLNRRFVNRRIQSILDRWPARVADGVEPATKRAKPAV